jgi:hypothetical protein
MISSLSLLPSDAAVLVGPGYVWGISDDLWLTWNEPEWEFIEARIATWEAVKRHAETDAHDNGLAREFIARWENAGKEFRKFLRSIG